MLTSRSILEIDFVILAIRSAFKYQTLSLWQSWFASTSSHTFEVNPGGLRVIFTEDPTNIRALLTTQFNDYGKGERFRERWSEFLGSSIFTTDLAAWQASRALLRPLFHKERVADLHTFETHVLELLPLLAGPVSTNTTDMNTVHEVDVADLFFRYTLDAATSFLLGKSVGSLHNPQVQFAEAFADAQRLQAILERSGQFRFLVPKSRFRQAIKKLNDFVEPFIERALSLPQETLASSSEYTFLHALAGFTRDRTVLRDQLVAVLLAARDTTAATLSWTIYELARHPQIVTKLRREVWDTVGSSKAPSYDDLKSMRYLQHVMSEVLRLYPAVPYNLRTALRDTTLPTGGGRDGKEKIGVLKDTPIAYSTLTMQRRPDLFPEFATEGVKGGDDKIADQPAQLPSVETFYPERWESWTPKAWTYIPFNGGPRICIGQQFALTEMGYTLVRILQRFEGVRPAKSAIGQEVKLKADIVLQPAGPVMVEFFGGQAISAE